MNLFGLAFLVGPATAVFREDVGFVDGKSVFLGAPLAVSQHGSQLAVVSDARILGLLNENGTLSWRHIIEPHQQKSSVAFDGRVVYLGGDYLSGFNASDGSLLWTVEYSSTEMGDNPKGASLEGGALITADGLLTHDSGAEVHSNFVNNGEARLARGTLSWDKYGVVTYRDQKSRILFTRDDGLAHIKSAIFVKVSHGHDMQNGEMKYETQKQNSFIRPLAERLARHLGELYDLVWYIMKSGPKMLVLPEPPKEQFQFDQVLVVVTEHGSVYGLNTSDSGSVSWVYHDLNAKIVLPLEASEFLIEDKDGELHRLTVDGDYIGETERPNKIGIAAIRVEGTTVKSDRWSVELPGDAIVGQTAKDLADVSASIAVPIGSNGSVLYKYLNPYAAAFASYSSKTRNLVITILDSVTGRVLTQSSHGEPVVINEDWPLQIIFGEYWVIYSYFSLDASETPKIAVIELFESSKENLRLSNDTVNVYSDTLVPHTKERSWILPSRGQPVYSMALSKSPHGASVRDIILAFEHQIVAVPKYLLSALAPPGAVLKIPQNGHLSHIYGVSRSGLLVTAPTNLESTFLVAALDGPDFLLSRASPSGEFDHLSVSFPKVKLVVLVFLLGFAVASMSPLARMKALHQQWR